MLQIITKRSNKLKKLHKISLLFVLSVFCSACAADPQPLDNQSQTQAKPATTAITVEPHKGRISPETSIARTLKYNIDTVKQTAAPKFLGDEARANALANFRKLHESGNGASVSLKELDFAILYTSANYYQDSAQIDVFFNQVIGQNLIQGALKAHKSAIFAHKKVFEIRRKIRQNQKLLSLLIKKQSTDDLDYQKTLEDTIDKLKAAEQEMNQNLSDFRQLVKINANKIELDGRRFFDELKIPPAAKVEDYQAAALNRRLELTGFDKQSLAQTDSDITAQYAENNERVKGFYIEDATYLQNLAIRGDASAYNLLNLSLNYQKAGKRKKTELAPKLGKELHKAIYTQVELAFSLAVRTNADFEALQNNIRQIKQDIQKLEKVSRPDNNTKIQLIKQQMSLLENEITADQILAERAMSLAALQIYSGQITVSPELLQKDLPTLAQTLKVGLKQKVSTYEQTAAPTLEPQTIESKHWTSGDNWLEEIMTEQQKQPEPQPQKFMSKPLGNRVDYNRYKTMQLGAYVEKSAAEKTWQELCAAFPELTNYAPDYEQTTVAGITLYRLKIHSQQGGFKDLCVKLRNYGRECMLYD